MMPNLFIGKTNANLWVIPYVLAPKFINIPYVYGGKNALIGLDCSGLVCQFLQALGAIPRNTFINSMSLYEAFKDKASVGEICLGSLAFYGKSILEIDHVGMFLDNHFIIEAAHGDHTTLTIAQAQLKDAKVRVSPFNYRQDLVAVLRPKYEDMGIHE